MFAGSKKSVLLPKEDYFNVIEELKEAEKTKTKSPRQYYILKR